MHLIFCLSVHSVFPSLLTHACAKPELRISLFFNISILFWVFDQVRHTAVLCWQLHSICFDPFKVKQPLSLFYYLPTVLVFIPKFPWSLFYFGTFWLLFVLDLKLDKDQVQNCNFCMSAKLHLWVAFFACVSIFPSKNMFRSLENSRNISADQMSQNTYAPAIW